MFAAPGTFPDSPRIGKFPQYGPNDGGMHGSVPPDYRGAPGSNAPPPGSMGHKVAGTAGGYMAMPSEIAGYGKSADGYMAPSRGADHPMLDQIRRAVMMRIGRRGRGGMGRPANGNPQFGANAGLFRPFPSRRWEGNSYAPPAPQTSPAIGFMG